MARVAPRGPPGEMSRSRSPSPEALESEVGANSHVPQQALVSMIPLPVQHHRVQRGRDPGGWTQGDPQPILLGQSCWGRGVMAALRSASGMCPGWWQP